MSTKVSKPKSFDNGGVEWTIKNWTSTHKIIIAAEDSCHIRMNYAGLGLRLFLRSKEDIMSVGNLAFVLKSYSLWGEVEGVRSNAAIKITASVRSGNQPLLTRDGTIACNNSKGKTVEVIDRFLSSDSRSVGSDGIFSDVRFSSFLNWPEITINIKAEVFEFNED